uniref:Uncharacterized protein n=1 Tax=Plectus sambesii TaxID=2011161 RepID=A0A914VHD8_9BILA
MNENIVDTDRLWVEDLEEESKDLPAEMLSSSLFVIHDPSGRRQDDVSEAKGVNYPHWTVFLVIGNSIGKQSRRRGNHVFADQREEGKRHFHANEPTTDYFTTGMEHRPSQFGISMSEANASVAFREARQMSIVDIQQDQDRLRAANTKALRMLITPDLPCTPDKEEDKIRPPIPGQPSTSKRLSRLEVQRRSFAHASNSRTNSETMLVVSPTKERIKDSKKVVALHLSLGFCFGIFATLLVIGCIVVITNPFEKTGNCSLPTPTNQALSSFTTPLAKA